MATTTFAPDSKLIDLINSHEHEWQDESFAWYIPMVIYHCDLGCGLVKRVTRDRTAIKEYSDMRFYVESQEATTDVDLARLESLVVLASNGEDPGKNEYRRKQRMTPEALSELAETERDAYEAARTEHGDNTPTTRAACGAYEDSLDILMYGNFITD